MFVFFNRFSLQIEKRSWNNFKSFAYLQEELQQIFIRLIKRIITHKVKQVSGQNLGVNNFMCVLHFVFESK